MKKILITLTQAILVLTLAIVPSATTFAVSSSTMTAAQTQRLQNIISRGDQEITRRLAKLGELNTKITAAAKLNSSDKTVLTAQVTSEISGLTALKSKLDAETTLVGAQTDAKSIITDYRVYALIVPKIALIRVADDQQVVQTKLTTAIQKLQANVTAAKTAGKDVSAVQAKLDDATAKVQAASTISMNVQSKVIGLQPTDYDNDHKILVGYHTQLVTARTDNKTALTDIQAVRDSLKSMQ